MPSERCRLILQITCWDYEAFFKWCDSFRTNGIQPSVDMPTKCFHLGIRSSDSRSFGSLLLNLGKEHSYLKSPHNLWNSSDWPRSRWATSRNFSTCSGDNAHPHGALSLNRRMSRHPKSCIWNRLPRLHLRHTHNP